MARRVACNDFLGVVRVFFSQECSPNLMTYRQQNHKWTSDSKPWKQVHFCKTEPRPPPAVDQHPVKSF